MSLTNIVNGMRIHTSRLWLIVTMDQWLISYEAFIMKKAHLSTIEAETRWQPFCRQHFKNLERKLLRFIQQGKSEGFESCDWPIVRKRPIWFKIGDVLYRVTLKFDGWPCKTIGHLFYATSSFVQHFVAIGEFKLELQSGNSQSGSKTTILEPWDLEIWRMTLQNNRAPLLCFFKLCASFHTHWWFQISVTVRKRSIWVKIDDFFSRVTLKFDGWPCKTIGHLFYATSSFVHHFIPIGDFKFQLQSGNAQFGSKSTIFLAVWPWNLTDDLQKQ